MKKVIVSFIISGLIATFLVTMIACLVYQGINIEMNKNANSAPSSVAFIPAALLGIMFAPYIVTIINHFKALKILKVNNGIYDKNVAIPLLIGYFLVIASILIVLIYLIFDGLLMHQIMSFNEPRYALAIILPIVLLSIIPIGMIYLLFPMKKKV